MNLSKMVRLSCMLVTVLTVLVLRTAVAQAAPAHSGSVGGVAVPNTAIPNEGLIGVAAISSKDIWTVGYSLVNSTSPLRTLTEHWNGTSWSVVTSPNVGTSDNLLYAAAKIASNDVWAVGYYRQSSSSPYQTLTEHWNGTSWSVVTSLNVGTSDNYLISVAAIATNDVWTVGEYHKSSKGAYQTLTEHWNGTSWSVVSSPIGGKAYNGLFSVAADATNDVWAVGAYQKSSSGAHLTLIEHWNGSKWSVVASSSPGASYNFFVGVIAISSSNAWAVGYSLASSTSPYLTLAEQWNGKSWSVVTTPNSGKYSNFLEGIAAISSSDIWSTGGYYTSGGSNPTEQTLAEHWNGSSWSVVSTPNFGGSSTVNALFGIAGDLTNDVWSVGYNKTSSTNFQAFTEHWNGSTWSIIPPG